MEGVNGSGMVASVTFKAKAKGQTTLSFRKDTITLHQPDGSDIEGIASLTMGTSKITVVSFFEVWPGGCHKQ